MRIAEISTPDLRHPSTQEPQLLHQPLISQLETLISQTETLSPNPSSLPETIPSDLRQTLAHLAQIPPFPNSLKLQIWKLSYRLWNACVDISNSINLRPLPPSSSIVSHHHAQLRHLASDMLFLASDVSGVPSREIKSASFYHKTGLIWHELRNFDIASTCFEKATDIVSKLDVAKISDSGERKLLLDINIARSRTAWEVSDRNLAVTLLNRSKTLLFGEADHYMKLANQFLSFSTVLLSKDEPNCHNEALKLMNEALDLSERGSSAARTREQMVELKKLSSKSLRFIAAVHLQKGEFESVIKCVKVLREGSNGTGDSGDSHGSLPVLAMKAWLGLGRYAEAEKELRGMVINKGIPENVWVSAVETYFESVGTGGVETAKGVFFGLLERCHVSAGAAIRVVSRVLQCGGGGAEGAKVRAKVVAELVSDKRVVALFEVETAAKARKALHAVLWNCAADHFRSKDYETSAEMFDKAMLYTPCGMEEKILRAKGFRVLCLCYLGLSQLDRAQEYINEAAKLDPNVACAFLKFKICLQKGDSSGAINQIQPMQTCLDFTPDFLSLSAHEAVASRAISVAVTSLSDLLNYYTSGRSMPTTEVVVLRTLITILTQDHVDETEVLKFMKRAHIRAIELGLECFYGKGEVGRREKNWFVVTAWNCGTKCGKEKKYELCAEFLRLVPEFCSCIINEQEEENNVMVCSSLILTVAAMIASENQKKIPLLDSEVKLAVEMLDRAAKMLSSVSSGIITSAPELFFMYTVNAYDIHGRLHDLGRQQQLLLVKSFASSKASSPNFLHQIGITASQGPRSNPEVASFALNESLSALLSSPVPDYHNIALIVRRLIALANIHKGDSDNDVVYSMYKQAYRIMVGLKEGEYPSEEGKWLAMSAWNRSALPVRLGQVDDAKKWMDIGLQLSRKVSGMETYRACMGDFASAFDRKFPSLKL